ncbi:hypothetical protein [Acinetobacter bereziniae]|uniref:hypothetical protein n=1 Tax=Acinetobacter bereziniae TaxID=106648 RepID=UPI000C2B8EF9|nr:hypothetical protein [Acinetobacter bereziniae]ATZ64874.1 hypothetical protein BSR55_16780 [Acinetobacter bereziniae]
MNHEKNSVFLYYLDLTAPFYYFYLIPVAIALVVISFDFSFYGIFPTTITSTLSSQHKFLNDFFALCNFLVIGLIFVNYLRYPLRAPHVRQIREDYARLNQNQQSINGWLGIIFFCFILCIINLVWFLIDDEALPSYREWRRGDTLTYLRHFAHPYISTFAISFQYVIIVFLVLMFTNILNNRKYRSD